MQWFCFCLLVQHRYDWKSPSGSTTTFPSFWLSHLCFFSPVFVNYSQLALEFPDVGKISWNQVFSNGLFWFGICLLAIVKRSPSSSLLAVVGLGWIKSTFGVVRKTKRSEAEAGWGSWKNRLSPVQTICAICSQNELRVWTRFITGPIRGKD